MMNRNILAAAIALLTASAASAAPILIDGSTSDWGVTVADNNGSVLTSFAGNIGLIDSAIEDTNDTEGDGGFLGPNQGGQNYDVEAMAVAIQGNIIYGLIVSGQRNDNGFERFSPGDILIQTTGGLYAIEVGGGAGGGGPNGAIVEGANGSSYALNGNGFTTGHSSHAGSQIAGTVWKNAGLVLDPIPPQGPTQIDSGNPGTKVGLADFIFTRDSFTTQHSIIEFSLDRSMFGDDTILFLAFRPSCGNDELSVVPEPSTLAMLAPFAFFVLRRNRKR